MTSQQPLQTTDFTAVQLAEQVRTGRVSARDMAAAHLSRIADLDQRIGAFECVDPARVLAQAAAIDARPDRPSLPLAGVPVAVKDNIDVAGYPTRHGSTATVGAPAAADDEIVRRLRAAGAVVIGKTRMPELAAWAFTQSSRGITRNPVAPDLDPGGSSGGSAAAVAAGMAVLGIGTDGGGSLRVPAAYCGIVGVKPTAGLVPLPGDLAEHWCGLTAAGPLARTAEDAALLLDVLAGRAGTGLPDALPGSIAVSFRSPSVLARLTPPYRAAVSAAARRLAAGGQRTTNAEPPYPPTLIQRWMRRWLVGVARDADRLGLPLQDLEPRTASMVRRGRRIERLGGPRPAVSAAWRERMLRWFDDGSFDVLLLPAVAAAAVPAGSQVGRGYLGTLMTAAAAVPYAQAWNLAGLPAVVAQVRTGETDLPVQLVGRPGSERALLAVAAQLRA